MRTNLKLGIAVLLATGWLLVAFVLLEGGPAVSRARPLAGLIINSDIVTDTTWRLVDSPITLTTDIMVTGGAVLTVEPGVVVRSVATAELKILGHLHAAGTSGLPITFTVVNGVPQWGGLLFEGGTGQLKHVDLLHGGEVNSIGERGGLLARNVLTGQLFIESSRILSATDNGGLQDSGLYLENSRLTLSDTLVAYNGNSAANGYGLYAAPGSSTVLTVTNSQILSNSSIGLYFDTASGTTITVTGSTFQGNGTLGMYIDPGVTAYLSGNSFSGNGSYPLHTDAMNLTQVLNGGNLFANNNPDVFLTRGTLPADVTFAAANGLTGFELDDDVIVPDGITLTVNPGTTIYGQSGSELRVSGRLAAVGTAANPITFTSVAKSGGGDWSGLVFSGGQGDLQYASVRYGGQTNSRGWNSNVHVQSGGVVTLYNSSILTGADGAAAGVDYGLLVFNSRAVVSNSLIAGNGDQTLDYGVQVSGTTAALTMTNSVIHSNTGIGLYTAPGLAVSLTGNSFTNNGKYPLRTDAPNLGPVLNSGSTFTGNTPNYLVTAGTMQESLTFSTANGLDGYELDDDVLTVPTGLTLTVKPGVTVLGGEGIEVRGHLAALGTATQPITLLQISRGLYFDGGTGYLRYATVLASHQHAIFARNVLTGQVRLEDSQILSSGFTGIAGPFGGMLIDNSHVVISDTRIADNGGLLSTYPALIIGGTSVVTMTGSCVTNNVAAGINMTGGQLSVSASDISGNNTAYLGQEPSLINNGPTPVAARFNWWGHPSGPRHPGNPLGQGEIITGTGTVDYSDWLSEPICDSYLRLGKLGPDFAVAGQPITYTLKVSNRSGITATNLLITDAVPAGATFITATLGGQLVSDEVQWTVPELAGYSSVTVSFVVTATNSIVNDQYRVSAADGSSAPGAIPLETTVVKGGSGLFGDSGQRLGNANSQAVAIGDLDGNGTLDAIVANSSPNQIWLNNGSGAFNLGDTAGDGGSQAIALGDLDGDGDLDTVVGNGDGEENQIWLNNGSGVFTPHQNFGATQNTQAVALGDLDGDGRLDAFVGGDDSAEVWLNSGGGALIIDPRQPLSVTTGVQAVALSDVDGDGDLDAYVGTGGGAANQVWLNEGIGVFSTTQTLGSSNGQAVALGDLDGDTYPDIVVGTGGGEANQVWLNNGAGAFSLHASFGFSQTQAVALGDIDADGDTDAVVGHGSGQPNEIWLNDGHGVFTTSGQVLPPSTTNGLAVGDFDGDGDLDIFEANGGGADQSNRVWFNLNPLLIGADGGLIIDVSQGLTTTVQVPPNAVLTPTLFLFTPLISPTASLSATARFAGRGFQLDAFQTGQVFTSFNRALTVTMHYSPVQVTTPGELRLNYLEPPDTWLDAAATCGPPPSDYFSGTHFIAVAVCHLTEFGLLETVQSKDGNVFLPVILKNQ